MYVYTSVCIYAEYACVGATVYMQYDCVCVCDEMPVSVDLYKNLGSYKAGHPK